ncbi:hypothetical protein [Flavobacterium psychrotrophum]|uniref:hypothetical protein n=1 Tax=Flavobacterium psychrotrophum TaxID=2294119 RepID=UPI000E30E708|nr:hypothetical protein [Flavobacterium psychrotrophum]
MLSKRIKPLIIALVLYFIGFFLYKFSNGNMLLVVPGAIFMFAGLVMNVIFMIRMLKDVLNK